MAYSLPNVKPWVVAAANEIGPKFGIKSVGGWNNTEVPRYGYRDHPLGLALDFMTGSGDALANYATANASRLGISYVIWNRRIWNPSQGWKAYTGTSNPHTDHVHVSFLNTAPTGGGAPVGGGTTNVGLLDGGLVGGVRDAAGALKGMVGGINAVGDLAKKAMWLALPTTQVRIVTGILGVGFLLIGVRFLVREVRNG